VALTDVLIEDNVKKKVY